MAIPPTGKREGWRGDVDHNVIASSRVLSSILVCPDERGDRQSESLIPAFPGTDGPTPGGTAPNGYVFLQRPSGLNIECASFEFGRHEWTDSDRAGLLDQTTRAQALRQATRHSVTD